MKDDILDVLQTLIKGWDLPLLATIASRASLTILAIIRITNYKLQFAQPMLSSSQNVC